MTFNTFQTHKCRHVVGSLPLGATAGPALGVSPRSPGLPVKLLSLQGGRLTSRSAPAPAPSSSPYLSLQNHRLRAVLLPSSVAGGFAPVPMNPVGGPAGDPVPPPPQWEMGGGRGVTGAEWQRGAGSACH